MRWRTYAMSPLDHGIPRAAFLILVEGALTSVTYLLQSLRCPLPRLPSHLLILLLCLLARHLTPLLLHLCPPTQLHPLRRPCSGAEGVIHLSCMLVWRCHPSIMHVGLKVSSVYHACWSEGVIHLSCMLVWRCHPSIMHFVVSWSIVLCMSLDGSWDVAFETEFVNLPPLLCIFILMCAARGWVMLTLLGKLTNLHYFS